MPVMDNEKMVAFVRTVARICNKALAVPRGKKFAELQQYVEPFTDDELALFFKRLATSKWVNSDYFSFDRMIKDNLIAEVMAGGKKELHALHKYYKPVTITRVRYVHAEMPSM
jgi:hypothetical protein